MGGGKAKAQLVGWKEVGKVEKDASLDLPNGLRRLRLLYCTP